MDLDSKNSKSTGTMHPISSEQIYGLPSPLTTGMTALKAPTYTHPLQSSEKVFLKNQHQAEMMLLRNVQGIHAPLKLSMELKATEKIGRLPFLPSSNLMRDVILGRDEDIGYEDFLNIEEFREVMGQPHAVVEKSLGIL